jgi:hypothetical protein
MSGARNGPPLYVDEGRSISIDVEERTQLV